ncbi:hypothetical protein E4U17_000104 [Claviceps sp. LM77 group G4]|nr:hypothetical protein E4U17_000104 [Claviceps sp. LM77 group G4]
MTIFQGLFCQGPDIPDLLRFVVDEDDDDDDLRRAVSVLWSYSALGSAKRMLFRPYYQRLQEYSTVAAQLQRSSANFSTCGGVLAAELRRWNEGKHWGGTGASTALLQRSYSEF